MRGRLIKKRVTDSAFLHIYFYSHFTPYPPSVENTVCKHDKLKNSNENFLQRNGFTLNKLKPAVLVLDARENIAH